MSDLENPYASPSVEASPVDAPSLGAGVISPLMKEALKAASPWMVFMGVIGFVGAGFMVLGGIIMMVSMGLAGRMAGAELAEMSPVFGAMGPLIGLFYIAGAVLMVFPSRFLFIAGTRLKTYSLGESSADLEAALVANKSYWKFQGILAIVSMALVPIATIVGTAIALVGVAANM